MKRSIGLVLTLAACTGGRLSERYGFVATLGSDTVSVERITRTPTTLVSDGVDRFPLVRQRHTEFDLAPDGRVRRMVMDVRTPSGPSPAERGRRISATFTNSAVLISVRDSAGVKDTTFATRGALTVPHVSMMYSVIELEIATSLLRARAEGMNAGDSMQFRQFYPDRDVGPSFALHRGYVHPLGGGRVGLRHDWLSGTGEASVDSSGRMLTYSGMRSTYKVLVTRTADLPDVEAIGTRFAAAERRGGASQLSVRDTARAQIGPATIAVDYGRPLARGRTLLGSVIDYDRVWRTGANAATQFTTSAPIALAGLSLPAGTYTLWTAPHTSGVELIVNKQSGQWGTQYDKGQDLGRAPLHTESVTAPVEKFSISIVGSDASHATLAMEWGTFRWTAPIVLR